jgi:hypothetical protein
MPPSAISAHLGFGKLAHLAYLALLVPLACASTETSPPTAATPQREPGWISGEVMGVDRVPVDQYNDSTVRLVVTTEAPDPVQLDLGPGWYVDKQGLSFEPDQRIEYRGSQNSEGSVTVYEIRKGDSKVQLRDEKGEPRWNDERGTRTPDAPQP